MKRVLLVLLGVILLAGPLFGQSEDQDQPTGAVGLVLLGSPAVVGIGVELFLEQFGVAGTLTTLPLGGDSGLLLILEPGFYTRYYFGELESSFFLTAGVSYLTLAAGDYGDVGLVDGGIFRVNSGIGYNSFLGRDNSSRFSFEIGPRFNRLVTNTEDEDTLSWVFLHFMLTFGKTF
ncbi:MAG: hypothetical protein ACOCW6_02570 [Spirochaetota bacterium]